MKKTLRKPENWQDFESLCKKLWGEVWSCDEIKKNGRNGQKQHGVDVYGIPKNEIKYFGIQCKGKDDYTKSGLSKKEIDTEINNAKEFEPKLKKFYFTTTANKDSEIEKYIRLKNIENIENGLFEIHLFSWEDIVDLIEENKRTFDWYVKNIDHKTEFSIKVTFGDNSIKTKFNPILVKNHISYKFKKPEKKPLISGSGMFPLSKNPLTRADKISFLTEVQPIRYYINGKSQNKSSSVFSIKLKNDGNTQIENFKLYFELIGNNFKVETVTKQFRYLDSNRYSYDTFFYDQSNEGIFEPNQKVLVQKDSIISDKICIRPTVEEPIEVFLKWKFISKDFDEEGILTLHLDTKIIETHTEEETDCYLKDEIRLENFK